MSLRAQKNKEETNQLSPWGDERQQVAFFEQPAQDVPTKVKRLISVAHKKRKKSGNKEVKGLKDVGYLKIVDYELPLIKQKGCSIAVNHQSMTIEPPLGRVIRNKSNHRLNGDHFSTITTERTVKKLKLNGKKFEPLPNELQRQSNRWLYDQTARIPYNSSTHGLLFTRSKDDVLKGVLFQLQGKIY